MSLVQMKPPVGDAGAFDGGLVAVGLGHRPGGHESACAPAEDGEAIGIGPALGDGEVGCAVYIFIGAVAEVLVNGGEKIGTIAG